MTVSRQAEAPQTPNGGLLTHSEFYDALDRKIGKNALYGFMQSGTLKSVQIGRKRLILASEVADFPKRLAERG